MAKQYMMCLKVAKREVPVQICIVVCWKHCARNERSVVADVSRVSGFKDATFEQVNAGIATEDGGWYWGGMTMKTNQPAKKINANVILPTR